MTVSNIISIQELNHFFGKNELRKQILFDISLEIKPQEFVILTGPSGSGKSTLLSLVGCLRSVQSGSLNVLGQELKDASKKQLTQIRRNFGYITQSSNLLDSLTVQQNVQMSLELHARISLKERRTRAKAMLEAVGLGDFIHTYPDKLSGGQRQRVAIASALVTQPKLILADEPTAALDRASGRNVANLMHRLAKEQGSAVLMVTHDNRIFDVADRIINVEDGKLGLSTSRELAIAVPGLDTTLLDQAETQPTVLNYAAGEPIVQQGEWATKFYVLLEGEVEVFRELPGQAPQLIRKMLPGEYFGEIGLLQKHKRTATVRVTQAADAKVMAIDEVFFRTLMSNSELTKINVTRRLNQRMMMDRLTPVFPKLTPADLSTVLANVEVVRYGPNSKIVQIGDIANKFYLVWKGQVAVVANGEANDESVLRTLQTGEYFGDRELIESRAFEVSLQTQAGISADIMIFSREEFHRLAMRGNAPHDAAVSMPYNHFMAQIDSISDLVPEEHIKDQVTVGTR